MKPDDTYLKWLEQMAARQSAVNTQLRVIIVIMAALLVAAMLYIWMETAQNY